MLKRLPVRDRTLLLAFLIAASLYGAKASFEATTAGTRMVDKAPITCERSHDGCPHMGGGPDVPLDTDQLG